MSDYCDSQLQRAQGAGRIVLDEREGVTRIVEVFQRYPIRIMFPRSCGQAIEEAVIVNSSGGIAGGDRLETAVTLMDGASIAVTTQAAEKVYRALTEPGHVVTQLSISERARLAWLPQETIVFDRARLRRETEIRLVSGAELLALEWLVLGRAAHGEEMSGGYINDSWRVSIDGRLVWADSFRVTDSAFPQLHKKALLCDARTIATMVCFAPHPERRLESLREIACRVDCELAVTVVAGLVIARFAACRSTDLRAALQTVLAHFEHEPGHGPFRVPKMWSC